MYAIIWYHMLSSATIGYHILPYDNHMLPCAALCYHMLPKVIIFKHMLPYATICYHRQPYATICCHMRSYATICCCVPPYAKHMLLYAALLMLPYATICNIFYHMLPYAAICDHLLPYAVLCNHLRPYATMCCYTLLSTMCCHMLPYATSCISKRVFIYWNLEKIFFVCIRFFIRNRLRASLGSVGGPSGEPIWWQIAHNWKNIPGRIFQLASFLGFNFAS